MKTDRNSTFCFVRYSVHRTASLLAAMLASSCTPFHTSKNLTGPVAHSSPSLPEPHLHIMHDDLSSAENPKHRCRAALTAPVFQKRQSLDARPRGSRLSRANRSPNQSTFCPNSDRCYRDSPTTANVMRLKQPTQSLAI